MLFTQRLAFGIMLIRLGNLPWRIAGGGLLSIVVVLYYGGGIGVVVVYIADVDFAESVSCPRISRDFNFYLSSRKYGFPSASGG